MHKFKWQQRTKRIILALMSLLTLVSILITGVRSYAVTPDTAYIVNFQGNKLTLGTGDNRRQAVKRNDRLEGNKILYIPGGNKSWADLAFALDAPKDYAKMIVKAGPHNNISEWSFPCTARGGFTISWKRGDDRGCEAGVKVQSSSKRGGLPNNNLQASRRLLAQAEDEVTVVPTPRESLIQTADTATGIKIDVLVGDVRVKSAKNPGGRLVKAGERYDYPQDTITPIDPNQILNSSEMQDFLNPNNWRSPDIPERVANGIAGQLGELRTALNQLPQRTASQSTQPQSTTPETKQSQPAEVQTPQVQSTTSETTQFQFNATNLVQGTSHGDPHIITFDGFRYSFQTVGEFILVKSKDGVFEIQVRQAAIPGRQISLNTGVAMKVGNSRVAFYSKDFPDSDTNTPLRIDGKPTTMKDNTLTLPGGGAIAKTGDNYLVQWPTGEQLTLYKTKVGDSEFMNVMPAIPDSKKGLFTGLLGNFNGNQGDDLQTRSGDVIATKSSYGELTQALQNALPVPLPLSQIETAFFEQLYKKFGDSWRISPAESLFDYASGQTTETFTNRNFPSSYTTIASLLPAQIREAQAVCERAGVSSNLLEGCIFDVGSTGESGFAQAAANAIKNVIKNRIEREIRNRIPIPIPIRIPGF